MAIKINGNTIQLGNNIRKVRINGHTVYSGTPPVPPVHDDYLYFTGTGKLRYGIEGTVSCNIQTSSDMVNWTNWESMTLVQLTSSKLYVRNTMNTLSTSDDNWVYFNTEYESGSALMGGNIMSLINYSDLTDYCFNKLFMECFNVDIADDFIMPATTLAPHCYSYMFYYAEELTKAPELPATTLATNCYSSMFYDCKALTTAPALPATTLAPHCYSYMFYNCSSLNVSENSGSHLIFTCPDPTGISYPVSYMFSNTGGSFKGKPTPGNSYYYN